MFRRSCVALALVLILAVTPLPAAQADPIPNDVQAAPVEAQVAESASAAALEGTGLAMEDAADAVFAPQPTAALPPSPTEEVIAVTYARAARADCPVYAGPDASLPIGRVAEGGVVLLPRGAAEGRVAAAGTWIPRPSNCWTRRSSAPIGTPPWTAGPFSTRAA